jgi:hypothetical protein
MSFRHGASGLASLDDLGRRAQPLRPLKLSDILYFSESSPALGINAASYLCAHTG